MRRLSEFTSEAPGQDNRLRHDAEIGTTDAAVPDYLANDNEASVARDRKANALCAVDHRGVDGHHLAGRRYKRPARAARIERRIRLDDILNESPIPGSQRPPK